MTDDRNQGHIGGAQGSTGTSAAKQPMNWKLAINSRGEVKFYQTGSPTPNGYSDVAADRATVLEALKTDCERNQAVFLGRIADVLLGIGG